MVRVHTPKATGYVVRLKVNKTQAHQLTEYARLANYAYNYANRHRTRVYTEKQAWQNDTIILKGLALKARHNPWLQQLLAEDLGAEVSKLAVLHNTTAYNRHKKAWSTKSNAPRSKSEGNKKAFAVAELPLNFTEDTLTIAGLGTLRTWRRDLDLQPPEGAVVHRVTFWQKADDTWWMSVSYEGGHRPPVAEQVSRGVGIDLNTCNMAAVADGETEEIVDLPNVEHIMERTNYYRERLAALEMEKGRRGLNSNRAQEYQRQLKKWQQRYKDTLIRGQLEFAHQVIKRHPEFIVLEGADDEGTRPMDIRDDLGQGKYAGGFRRAAANGWRLLVIKWAAENGIPVYYAPKHFPSTKRCSSCGQRQPMPPELRTYECPACGLSLERDINAARNLYLYGLQVRDAGVTNARTWALARSG